MQKIGGSLWFLPYTFRTRPIKRREFFCYSSEPRLFQFTFWFALKFIQTVAYEEVQLELLSLSFTLLQSNLVNFSVNSIFFTVFSRFIRAKFVKADDVIPLSIFTYSNLGELIVGLDRPWNGKDRLHIPLQTIQCAGVGGSEFLPSCQIFWFHSTEPAVEKTRK